MSKILYNKETGLLHPWPAGDADHVVGLDAIYEEFDVLQNERPEHNPATHHLQPFQNIRPETQTVERGWNVVENPPLPAREATLLQIRLFLERRSIGLETVPALIASVTAGGSERNEALIRWDKTLSFPKEHPLVVAVAALLSLNLDEVWDEILAIE